MNYVCETRLELTGLKGSTPLTKGSLLGMGIPACSALYAILQAYGPGRLVQALATLNTVDNNSTRS